MHNIHLPHIFMCAFFFHADMCFCQPSALASETHRALARVLEKRLQQKRKEQSDMMMIPSDMFVFGVRDSSKQREYSAVEREVRMHQHIANRLEPLVTPQGSSSPNADMRRSAPMNTRVFLISF